MASPVNVTVTGAAGQIGYALLFRIASGQMLGPDTTVHLKLLEIPDAVKAAEGTALELFDCAFPLLAGIDVYDDAGQAFDGMQCRAAGRRPAAHKGHGARRPAGGQRRHLQAPGPGDRGRRRRRREGARGRQSRQHERADRDEQRRRRAARAVHRDDAARSQRAVGQLAQKTGAAVSEISNMAVWGNHSPTMYPDLFNAKVRGERRVGRGRRRGMGGRRVHPRVGKRGAEIIEARGASSAASAANAAVDHVHDWVNGTRGRRLGLDGRAVPAPTASRRGSSPRSLSAPRTGSGRSSRASTCPTSHRSGSTRPSRSLRGADAVRELGLV